MSTDPAILLPEPLQATALRQYEAMAALRNGWARMLVLCCGLNDRGIATAMAGLVGGAAILCLDADPARLRHAAQVNATDFTVTTLSEAIRILKNEIRKGTAVSVGLGGGVDVLKEAAARGLQPDAVFTSEPSANGFAVFLQRGAIVVPELSYTLRIDREAAPNLRERRQRDEAHVLRFTAMADSADEPTLARSRARMNLRWMRAVPSLFPRDLTRYTLAGQESSAR